MSRKKKNSSKNFNIQEVSLCEGTILEQFLDYTGKHRKVSDIITFLSVKNAELIGLTDIGMISSDLKEELFEFYDYFYENYDEVTMQARYENWGQEPFIFRLTESLFDAEEERVRKEYISSVPAPAKREAKSLCDTLFSIRENRILSFIAGDDYFSLEIPKTIYREGLKAYREQLYFLCCIMVAEHGALTVRLNRKGSTEIFGIRVLPIGVWSPISKEEMKTAHCTTPTGIELEPEEGVTYTEIMREKF